MMASRKKVKSTPVPPAIRHGSISLARMVSAEQKAEMARGAFARSCDAAIRELLDGKARERGYDSLQSAVSYCADPNPRFASEAAALLAWRSAIWTYAGAELALVESGTRTIEAIEGFLEEIREACPFAWPA